MNRETDERLMRLALTQAQLAMKEGEVPVGAVLTFEGSVLSAAYNRPIAGHDPSAHAEILAIREAAGKLENYRLPASTLYVTLEPCIMCAGAIIQARIGRLVYGATDPKAGGVASLYRLLEDGRINHQVQVTGGILEGMCAEILSRFFREKRITSRPVSGMD